MKVSKLIALGVSLAFSVSLVAGYVAPQPVDITLDPANNLFRASGDMGTARWADDDVTYIGCGIRKFTGGFETGFCQARDEAETQVICQTQDPELLEALAVINDTSYIVFSWTPNTDPQTGDLIYESGECTYIGISSQSFYIRDGKGKL